MGMVLIIPLVAEAIRPSRAFDGFHHGKRSMDTRTERNEGCHGRAKRRHVIAPEHAGARLRQAWAWHHIAPLPERFSS